MHTNICPKSQNHPVAGRFLYTSTILVANLGRMDFWSLKTVKNWLALQISCSRKTRPTTCFFVGGSPRFSDNQICKVVPLK